MEEPGAAPPRWDYVGMGRGGWVNEYKFVGEGAGDFDQRMLEEQPKTGEAERSRLVCCGVSCCVVLALLVYLLVLGSLLRSRQQQDEPPVVKAAEVFELTTSQTPLPYNCDDGWTAHPKSWSSEVELQKQAWCCDNYDRCVPTASETPEMNCTEGIETWEESWSLEQKASCCSHPDVDCVPSTRTRTTTTSYVFSCDSADAGSLLETWSAEKISWCCDNRGIACSTSGPSLDFDCEDGLDRWETGWSVEKKEQCCEVTRRCVSTTDASLANGLTASA